MRGEGTTFNHWVCEERGGPTPIHPEPGRETSQRRSYWRLSAGNLGPRTRPMMTPGNQIRLPGVVCLVHALFFVNSCSTVCVIPGTCPYCNAGGCATSDTPVDCCRRGRKRLVIRSSYRCKFERVTYHWVRSSRGKCWQYLSNSLNVCLSPIHARASMAFRCR